MAQHGFLLNQCAICFCGKILNREFIIVFHWQSIALQSSICPKCVSSITLKNYDGNIITYIYYYDFQLQNKLLVVFNSNQYYSLKRT